MRSIRVLIVAPYAGLKEMANAVRRDRPDIVIDVVEGNLEQGVIAAKKLQKNDYDAIISRGGTALLLMEALETPVIEIDFSVYDMLRIMRMMDYMSMKGVIVGFPSIASCARVVGELLGSDIRVKTIGNASEVESVLLGLRDEGYNLIIGDQIVHDEARRLDLNSVLFPSGVEALNKAIDEAARISAVTRRLRDKADMYRQLLAGANEHAHVATRDGRVLYSDWDNGEPAFDAAQKRIAAGSPPGGEDWVVEDADGAWRMREVALDGEHRDVVAYFGRHIPRPRQGGATELKAAADMPEVFFHLCTGGDSRLERLREDVSAYGRSMLPTMLLGESGSGKTNIAYAMHRGSAKRKELLAQVACERLTGERFRREIAQSDMLAGGEIGTLYLDGVDLLPEDAQEDVYQFLKQCVSARDVRLLFSSERNVEALARERRYHRKLARLVTGLVLEVPPLRERLAGLDGITGMILSECNARFGRQALGLDGKARELMRSYGWPGNIAQLNRVLSALVIKCQKPLIGFGDLQEALREEDAADGGRRAPCPVDMSDTLERMTRSIVMEVLKQENMNQTQTAKRLGISRSTLWRVLKADSL